MGYKIRVNHTILNRTADAVDTYVRNMNSKMNSANTAVSTMLATWQGDDAKTFKVKWDTVDNADSTHGMMKKALESYSSFLRDAGSKYKNAQINAINRANGLPKW